MQRARTRHSGAWRRPRGRERARARAGTQAPWPGRGRAGGAGPLGLSAGWARYEPRHLARSPPSSEKERRWLPLPPARQGRQPAPRCLAERWPMGGRPSWPSVPRLGRRLCPGPAPHLLPLALLGRQRVQDARLHHLWAEAWAQRLHIQPGGARLAGAGLPTSQARQGCPGTACSGAAELAWPCLALSPPPLPLRGNCPLAGPPP